MRTAEECSGTVLHRLIREQLRYGNLADTHSLLAIQQQALRGGGGGGGSGGGTASPRSSLESLTPEDSPYVHMSSTRQEPQGQEHRGDSSHSESPVCHLYQLHGEDLPSYEEAKAHSQYLTSRKGRPGTGGLPGVFGTRGPSALEAQWDAKREHARSLSERLMQLSLERSEPRDGSLPMSSAHSFPQLYGDRTVGPLAPHGGYGGQLCPDNRGPPPEYPFCVRLPGYMLSHSEEQAQHYREPPPPFNSQHRYVSAPPQMAHDSGVYHAGGRGGSDPFAGGSPGQMDALMRENARLRQELDIHAEKAAKLQRLELEIHRISEAYETLMKGSAKREALEKTMRNKLEAEVKRMHDFNRDLRERLDTASRQRAAKEVESTEQKQHIFTKLIEQNEEQQRERERVETQLQQLRCSGEEWLRRREALEKALASAQAHNQRLEEELQRKRAYVAKVERLQSSLGQLQAACEKREALELRLRTRLEQELKSLRAQQTLTQMHASSGPFDQELNRSRLQQQLREREERVLALEADITRWEQKYLEESTMRQFAMDAAATAAAQRDTTIINHTPGHSPNSSFNRELPSATPRQQEMENRIRALHARLLEKDAVINVLQQRSRWEQVRLERQGLRPARSVPSSINVMGGGQADLAKGKGKSLSDDQTGDTVLPSRASTGCLCQTRDSSTQSDMVFQGPPLTRDSSKPAAPETNSAPASGLEELKAPLKTFKNISCPDAEVVEILI